MWILDYKRIDGDLGFDDVTMAARGHIPGELWVARHHAGAAQLIRLDGEMPTDIHRNFPNFTISNVGTLRGEGNDDAKRCYAKQMPGVATKTC